MVDPEEMIMQNKKIQLMQSMVAIAVIATVVLFTILTKVW